MAIKKFYIKERHNPQTGIYYVSHGQLTKKEAKNKENPIYGTNYMHSYDTKDEYEAAIEKLKKDGKRVQ